MSSPSSRTKSPSPRAGISHSLMTRHPATPSPFTPSGAIIRLADSVDSGLAFVNNTCARSNAAVSGVCTVAFGIPLRICKSVLLIFEHLFGVKHRAILVAQRKKSRRSNLNVENSRLDDSAVDLTSGSPSLTPGKRNLPAGVKFDMENSPGAAKLLNLVSPNKRRASMSDGEEEEETSFDDSSNDEVIDYNLLDNSENYKSEEDPDFEVTSDLLKKEERDLSCVPSFTESDNEQLQFRHQEATSKEDDMLELAYDDMDLQLGECRTAKLMGGIGDSQFAAGKAVLGKTSPLKSVENTVADNNVWETNNPVVKLTKLSEDELNQSQNQVDAAESENVPNM